MDPRLQSGIGKIQTTHSPNSSDVKQLCRPSEKPKVTQRSVFD